MPNILSVSQATCAIHDVLETEFPFIWVRGEVASVSCPSSGHVYFKLTDGTTILPVVWFKSARWEAENEESVHPLTGEVLERSAVNIQEGQEVLCAGRITVYEARGVYQLVAELVQVHGAGDLQAAFVALKGKLAAAGFFDEAQKKDLPVEPQKVALITSIFGAAVCDFLRLAEERGIGAQIRIYPTLVQGVEAPKQIAKALRQADEDAWAEVLVLIRGGGSLEDLWAFNTEEVAEALFEVSTPVLCGVGHEPDFSIADYVADMRAATPSHAAQLLWLKRTAFVQQVEELSRRLVLSFQKQLVEQKRELEILSRGLLWFSPQQGVERLSRELGQLRQKLLHTTSSLLHRKKTQLQRESFALYKTMEPRVFEHLAQEIQFLRQRLERAVTVYFSRFEAFLNLHEARMRACDPKAPLQRGYSLLRLNGNVLVSAQEVRAGNKVDIELIDGSIQAEVLFYI